MDLQLIDGQFTRNETINMVNQMFELRIKFHENKIITSNNEEDIKMREKKIKFLQNELAEANSYLVNKDEPINVTCQINL